MKKLNVRLDREANDALTTIINRLAERGVRVAKAPTIRQAILLYAQHVDHWLPASERTA